MKNLRNDIELNIKMFRDQPFILGLGHGILKDTPPQHVEDLVYNLLGVSIKWMMVTYI